jgi:trimeric autotransporter adhesin
MLITAGSFLEVVLTNTIAGDGTVGDAGLATASRLRSPCGVAVDASGNINIADTYNNRIRMVTKSTGIITTVAGNGNYGYSGDGGLATSASLRRPYSAVVDASGNIYIADTFNNRIRKVTKSTGIITTVAGNGNYGYSGDGGLATSARLYNPYGAAADVSGNVYIADTYNNRIRMVTTSTGIITTVAGNGTYGYSGDGGLATSARLRYPSGVAFDASGNIYIADTYNGRIRKVTKSTGIITTVAGGGNTFSDGIQATSVLLNGPTSIAIDISGNIHFADYFNNRIRLVTKSTGIITTVAGSGNYGFSVDGGIATSVTLSSPQGVAIDVSGNIYIADYTYNRIRLVTKSTGIITTVAGKINDLYGGDGGLASAVRLSGPYGVAVDASENVYIADDYRIRMVTKSTGIITTVAGNGTFGNGGDGGPATSAKLSGPYGVAVDVSGNMYIADFKCIRMVTKSTGIITTVAGNGNYGYSGDGGLATSAELFNPYSVAVDASGDIYIADTYNNRIRVVTMSTGIITTVAGNGNYGYSGDGDLATSASLRRPYGAVVDASGNIYIADTFNNRIRIVTASTGIITTVAGNGTSGDSGDGGLATSARLYNPYGVAIDVSGNVYIADTYNNRIRLLTTSTGIITTVTSNGYYSHGEDGGLGRSVFLSGSYGVAVDTSGNIYTADAFNGRVSISSLVDAPTASPSRTPSSSGP